MIYEQYFSKEWDSLSRDEAMVRAFVLGIAAVREDEAEQNGEELERLRKANNRSFVDMAYGAGKRECMDLVERLESEAAEDDETDGLSVDTSEILSQLVVTGGEAPEKPGQSVFESDASVGQNRTETQVDVPAMLNKYGFLDTRSDDSRERLSLPDFLER